ncbi:hypothetical protein [Aphanothece sacrum]|uniref:Uncharacterized protein n=1 Tax=Aphanothece sacrum FPU1 TaxID=1920663 RepID=A0A401ID63_APHSA|nr:hypothetical protein [Aphanothece sacrum]GBF79174.1 hypothetical protein AsFPU1_0566 [Aphanothece sacrum FPU1]GBF86563.1 hypothetical protein AsFPU3_3634 [Aphanothece sacrum FPU3]
MKGQAIVGSLLMGFILPSYALASVYLPISLSDGNSNNFNKLETIEIAVGYLDSQQVANRLSNYDQQIRDIAGQYSGGKAKWRSSYFNVINSQQLRLNVEGKIQRKVVKDPSIRIGLYLQLQYQGNSTYVRVVSHDYEVWGGTCNAPCQDEIARRIANLPSYYQIFEQNLNNMI